MGGSVRHVELGARRGRYANEVVEQGVVFGDDERTVHCRLPGGRGWEANVAGDGGGGEGQNGVLGIVGARWEAAVDNRALAGQSHRAMLEGGGKGATPAGGESGGRLSGPAPGG
ncbi:hypothetical protein GCM10020216_078660 [Nonomuraea helvata]